MFNSVCYKWSPDDTVLDGARRSGSRWPGRVDGLEARVAAMPAVGRLVGIAISISYHCTLAHCKRWNHCGFVVRSAISAQATAVSGLNLKHATQALHNCVCCGVRAVGKLDWM